MAFYGRAFIYDGIPSETYGLFIAEIDANAVDASMGSSSMEILDQKLFRRATPYFYGSTPAPVLTFGMSAFSEEEMDAEHFQLVQKWLFSSRSYKKLQIDQVDMQNVYFNSILNDPQIQRVGNLIKGFSCTVTCDSPFAFLFPSTTTYQYTQSFVDNTVIFNNTSDDSGNYLYPQLEILLNDFGSTVSITNLDDDNRVFSFTNLIPNEILTIDCSLQTIVSSTGLKRLSHFNKRFLRLVSGINRLRIQGNVETLDMTTQFVSKKIGG